MSKWILSLASATMLVLAISGCGGSDGSSNVDGDASSNVGDTSPETSSPARDLSATPDQFGEALPAVPMIPELAE